MKQKSKVVISIVMVAILAASSVLFAHYMIDKRRQSMTTMERAIKAKEYCQKKGLNQNYCLLLDYSVPSGSPRLYVWSFEKGKVIYSGYAMHGPGKGSTAANPVFSNNFNSHCSSLGKFEVTRQHGVRNKSGYYLKGLETSNCNARARGIMIHPAPYVDRNTWRKYIPLNSKCCLGCVTVSCKDMAYISNIIKKEEGNLLLWSYCNG